MPAILHYQRERSLADVPAYAVGLQVRLPDGAPVYLALSATELVLYFQNDRALHYDREARLVKIAEPNEYWRLGRSNRILHTRKRASAQGPASPDVRNAQTQGGGIERARLALPDTDAIITSAQRATAAVWEALHTRAAAIDGGKPNVSEALTQLKPLLARAAAFDAAAARRDAARYRELYRSVAVLPPSEYNAVVLQLTEGCSYGQCTFCELYRGVPFRTRTVEEFDDHIRAVIAYQGTALRSRRSLFLGEANALTLSPATLHERLRVVTKHFELPDPDEERVPASWWLGHERRFDGVASFLDVFTGQRRTVDDWMQLRRDGLRRVYLGVESGCDELLEWLRKPACAPSISRTVTALKEANVSVALILLLGAGGRQFAAAHVRETVALLNRLPLGKGDTIYLSPLVTLPGGPYDTAALAAGIEPLSATAIDEQDRQIRAGLDRERLPGKPYLARYDLETFVD